MIEEEGKWKQHSMIKEGKWKRHEQNELELFLGRRDGDGVMKGIQVCSVHIWYVIIIFLLATFWENKIFQMK